MTRPHLALRLQLAALVMALAAGLLGTTPMAGVAAAQTAARASQQVPAGESTAAASRMPRAWLSHQAIPLAKGRVKVRFTSNAGKLEVRYRLDERTRRVILKVRRGAARVTLPRGATLVRARALKSKGLRGTRWVRVAPTPTPTPTTTPRPTGWPSTENTGVPAGVALTTYTGPSTITANGTVIRERVVNGNLAIQAANVQIINTRINGSITLGSPRSNAYSFTITDSEVHHPGLTGTGIMQGNFRATRIEVTGGNRSIYCAYNCIVEDSLVHKQGADVGGDAHFSGIRMEQNGTFRHNTLICEAARGPGTGCSAALTGYGDFAPVQNNLIENNIFIGNRGGGATMCAYGGSSGETGGKPYGHLASDIRFVNNVFTRGTSGVCGNLGAIKDFNPSRPGNVWTGNTWDDGTPISHNG